MSALAGTGLKAGAPTDPEDDSARLILADWLEEQGDSLADFIRVQIAIADAKRRKLASEYDALNAEIRKRATPDKDTLQLVFASEAELVTGLRLEVLSDPSLPNNGPGRAENGNFVLHDLDVTAVPLGDPSAARTLTFSHASASFSQNNYPIAGVIDDNPNTGWAVSARFGERHVAVFELAEDLQTPGGFVLVVRMQQNYGSRHTIGRLRIGVTNEARPLRASTLPEAVLDALALQPDARSPEAERLLHERFLATRKDLSDAIRLAAAHDVAWALANSSAFLFNR